MAIPFETDFLIVGAGPAGAALASFLGQNGMTGVVIASSSGTADTPRAHLLNPFGLECLRDIGLEDEARSLSAGGRHVQWQSMRWCRSMTGEEYGKIYAWGGHPDTTRDGRLYTPCDWLDLPQTYLEPMLVKYASHHGFQVRFSSALTAVDHDNEVVVCTVEDRVTRTTYQIRTRYLFGADGGRSTVARSQGFEFDTEPSSGVACNVLLNADLTHLMYQERHAQLHWIMKPDMHTRFGIAPTLRMVKPWTQWLLVAFSPGVTEDPFKDLTPRSPELIEYLRDIIEDETVDIEVVRLDPWVVRESVATHYSKDGRVFLLGDSAHRHPPAYGLGSNTCIQDAYNLAWKVAYVSKGLAGRGLLDTYDEERQPVGANLVKESNNCMAAHARVWEALGMFASSPEEGSKYIKTLSEATVEGAARREKLHMALEGKRQEGESIGLTMNQWYNSTAVLLDDELSPRPTLEGDPIIKTQVTTYPGSRLPHAWLDVPTRRKEISTHDLAGHGCFCLLTGHGGDAWKSAANSISKTTGIAIRAYGIGHGLDYYDVYRQWHDRREVEDDGCVLIRPDRYVAWRSMKLIVDCEVRLLEVLNKILHREELGVTKLQPS